MKNFGSILAFVAISASVVSARVLPAAGSIEVRAPYPVVNEIFERDPKKKGKAASTGAATAQTAATSATAKGAKKAAKGAAATNGTATADTAAKAATSATAGKKAKVS